MFLPKFSTLWCIIWPYAFWTSAHLLIKSDPYRTNSHAVPQAQGVLNEPRINHEGMIITSIDDEQRDVILARSFLHILTRITINENNEMSAKYSLSKLYILFL